MSSLPAGVYIPGSLAENVIGYDVQVCNNLYSVRKSNLPLGKQYMPAATPQGASTTAMRAMLAVSTGAVPASGAAKWPGQLQSPGPRRILQRLQLQVLPI